MRMRAFRSVPATFEVRLTYNPQSGALPVTERVDPSWFHLRLPGYEPTPLRDLPGLAAELGVGRVLVKDESHRLDLPAFKIMGASWACYRTLAAHAGFGKDDWQNVEDLRSLLAPLAQLCLVTATDGNHGRAVARMARWLGIGCQILVPEDTVPERIKAIQSEGAAVRVVAGTYDQAVKEAAALAGPTALVVSDTSWPGYDQVPRWVSDGYNTIFEEIDEEGLGPLDVVVLPLGVGAFGSAVINYFGAGAPAPRFLGVEPIEAACVEASLLNGSVVSLPGPTHTIMAGLNCQTASPVAYPALAAGLLATVAIGDGWAEEAMRVLARHGVVAGESGASCLAGVLALLDNYSYERERLGLTSGSTLLLFVTEGATDHAGYQRVVG